MQRRKGAVKGQGTPGRKAASKRTVATVELPGTEHIERPPRVGRETIPLPLADMLVGLLALQRSGRPVTATISDDGLWRSVDDRVARLLNDCFPPGDYAPRDYHPAGTLAGIADDVAYYLGGKVVELWDPPPLPPGAVP